MKEIPFKYGVRYYNKHVKMIGEIIVHVNELEQILTPLLSFHSDYKFIPDKGKPRKPFQFGEKKIVIEQIINEKYRNSDNMAFCDMFIKELNYFNTLRNDCAHSRLNFTGEMHYLNKNKSKAILLIRKSSIRRYTIEDHKKNMMAMPKIQWLLMKITGVM